MESGIKSRIVEAVTLAIGLLLAVGWFSFLLRIDLADRLRGDAFNYLSIAAGFGGWGDALSFVGERSVGFPLVVFAMMKSYGGVSADGSVLSVLDFMAVVMFTIHVVAVLGSYFLLRNFARNQGDGLEASPRVWLHAGFGAVLLAYPGLVGHTTVLLADSFYADLVLLGFALSIGTRHVRPWLRGIASLAGGGLLGFAVLCRPVYEPAALAALALGLTVSLAGGLGRRGASHWQKVGYAAAFALGFAACVGPAEVHCASLFGNRCLTAPETHDAALLDSLQRGMSSPRVYWSGNVAPDETDTTCGVGCRTLRDETLAMTWAAVCRPSPQAFGYGLPGCFLRRPDLGGLFLFKKTLALFDSYQFQDYAVDRTPRWARLWSRPFGAMSYAGFVGALVLLAASARDSRRTELVAFLGFTVVLGLEHSITHIEGRYGYGVVPGALFALFWLLGTAWRRPQIVWTARLCAVFLSLLFLVQTAAWDRSDVVLQRIEAKLSLGSAAR